MKDAPADLSLTAHVVQLAALRVEEEVRASAIRAKRDAFEATIAADRALYDQCRRSVADTEAHVRALALVAHTATGATKPAPGVSVVIGKQYDIDEPVAFAWAQSTGLCLVPASLDTKALGKLATVQALPFVTVREVPGVRIASNLTDALQSSAAITPSPTAESTP